MVDEKDILFGIVDKGDKSMIIMDTENPKLTKVLMGTLTMLAAGNEDFFHDIKQVCDHVEKHGDKIRKMMAEDYVQGRMAIYKSNSKLPN